MEKQLPLRKGHTFLLFFIIFFVLPLASAYAQGNLLGIYRFNGQSGSAVQVLTVSNKSAQADFSSFSRSSTLKPSSGGDFFDSRDWSTSPTLNPDSYIEFTVTAQPGYKLHLTNISFDNIRGNRGPSEFRIAHNKEGAFNKYFYGFTSAETSTTWDTGNIVVDEGESVTFRIFGWKNANSNAANNNYGVDNVALYGIVVPPIYINEFHYAASRASKTGFVEVVVPKKFTTLNTIVLSLYEDENQDGSGEVYQTETLNNFQFIDTTMYQDYNVFYLNIPDGLAEPVGGISLTTITQDPIQFLSYGMAGGMKAIDGPAAGQTSVEVEETETAADGPANSIILPEDFPVWTNYKAGLNTKGLRNGNLTVELPVELLFFEGKQTSPGVLLTWATAMEKNNDKFVVERSNKAEGAFIAIAEIKGKGNTLQEQHYKFIDKQPITGTTFYRLKQVDFDGITSYFKIIAVNAKETDQLLVYPNPITDNAIVAFKGTEGGTIQIYNKTGQIVYRKELGNNLTNATNLQLDNLPAGTYFLILESGKERQSKAFIKL